MAISYITSTSPLYTTGNLTLSAPATRTVGDLLILSIGLKPDTAVPDTPAGYTLLGSAAGGTGSTGIDTGPMALYVYYRIATNTSADSLSASVVSGNNVTAAQIDVFRNATLVWDAAGVGAADTTTGTTFSAVMPSDPGMIVGDMLLAVGVIPTDVTTPAQFSAQTVAATGMTTVNLTEIVEWDTQSGQDMGGWLAYGPVVTGTSSAAPTVSATAGGTTTNVAGPIFLVRMREGTAKTATDTGSIAVSEVTERTISKSASDTGAISTYDACEKNFGLNNLLPNPSFEDGEHTLDYGGLTPTRVTGDSANALLGSAYYSLSILNTITNTILFDKVPYIPAQEYRIALRIKVLSGTASAVGLYYKRYDVAGGISSATVATNLTPNIGWQTISGSIPASPFNEYDRLAIGIRVAAASSDFVVAVDALQINAGATLFLYDEGDGFSPITTTDTSNVKVYDGASPNFGPNNLMRNPSFEDGAHSPVSANATPTYVTGDSAGAWHGSDYYTVAMTGGVDTSVAFDFAPMAQGQQYTLSFRYKLISGTVTGTNCQMRISQSDDGGSESTTYSTLSSGTPNSSWQTGSVTFTPTATKTKVRWGPRSPASHANSYTIAIDGLQMNVGSTPSEYDDETTHTPISASDAGDIAVSDSGSVDTGGGGTPVSGSESNSLSVSETTSILVTQSRTDTGSIAVADVSVVALITTDTSAITITEVSSINMMGTVKAALANRETDRFNIGMLGASLMEGYPCLPDKTPAQYLARKLRAAYPTSDNPSGYGLMGMPGPSMPYPKNMWTLIAGTGGNLGIIDYTTGWGAKHVSWRTGPMALPPIAKCTIIDGPWSSFDLNILRGAFSATAGWYRVDGGDWVTFSMASSPAVNVHMHVDTVVNSTVEVTIDPAATGSFVIVNGITGYKGDEAKGIQVHGFGRGGYSVAEWMTVTSGQSGWDWRYDQNLMEPDLLVISDVGVNDGIDDGAGITAAAFKTNLSGMIDYIRAGGYTKPILLVAVWDITAVYAFIDPWQSYVTAIREVAREKGTQFLDLSTKMPPTPNAIYDADGAHGNANGAAYDIMADYILSAIMDQSYDFPSISISETSSITVTLSSTDGGSIAVSETRTQDSTQTRTDTSAISIAETAANDVTQPASDTGSISVTETAANDVTAPASDTGSISIADTSSLLISDIRAGTETSAVSIDDSSALLIWDAKSVSDTTAVSVSESASNFITFSTTDTGSVSISETRVIDTTSSATDTGSVSVSDVSALAISDNKSTSDTGSISVLDDSFIAKTLVDSDTGPITVVETTAQFVTQPASDSSGLGVTENTSTDSAGNTVDAGAVSISEATQTTVAVPATDTASLSASEVSSPAVSSSSTDTAAVTISENTSGDNTASASDTSSVSTTESTQTTLGLSDSDTGSITCSESSDVVISGTIDKDAVDTGSISISESVVYAVSIETTDSNSIIISEAIAIASTLSDSDTGAVTISESIASEITVSGTDGNGIGITETTSQSNTLSANDTCAIALSESESIDVILIATDSLSLVVVEDRSIANSSSTDDTAALAVTEAADQLIGFSAQDSSEISVSENVAVTTYIVATDSTGLAISDSSDLVLSSDDRTASDSASVSVAENIILNVYTPSSDTSALAITETTSMDVYLVTTDAAGVTISENTSGSNTAIASDSLVISIIEATDTTAGRVSSDTGSIAISDSGEVVPSGVIDKVGSDDNQIAVTEDTSIAYSINAVDTGALATSETTTIEISLSVSDIGSISITETNSFFISISTTDISGLVVSEARVQSGTTNVIDSSAISVAETEITKVTVDVFDTFGLSVSDSVLNAVNVSATDISSISIIETTVGYATVLTSDVIPIGIDEQGINALEISSNDTGEFNVTEQSGTSIEEGFSTKESSDLLKIRVKEHRRRIKPGVEFEFIHVEGQQEVVTYFEIETESGTMVTETNTINQRLGGDSETNQSLG